MTIIVYSYPRSGSCWVRYIVNELMGWEHSNSPSTRLIPNRKTVYEDPSPQNFCAKIHSINLWKQGPYIDFEKDKLIVLIRNYKECIVRNNRGKDKYNIYKAILIQPEDDLNISYIHPIIFYQAFTKNRKLLLYYEDLMKDPNKYIWQIADLLNVDPTDFLKNIEKHKRISHNNHPTNSKNETRGEKEFHYIYELGKEKAEEWDNMFKQRYPELYYTYLVRYEGYPDE